MPEADDDLLCELMMIQALMLMLTVILEEEKKQKMALDHCTLPQRKYNHEEALHCVQHDYLGPLPLLV